MTLTGPHEEQLKTDRAIQYGQSKYFLFLSALGIKPVSFTQWEHIDTHEQELGTSRGKPREKIVDSETLLSLAHEID